MHLTLRQFQYFVGIVDAGAITRAAERLGLAPTALSLQVRTMEDRLGVTLLRRHSRGVAPTSEGQELYERGRQILALVEETERCLTPSTERVPPRVRLGLPPSALRLIGVEAVLAGTREQGASVEIVEAFSSELVERLGQGELDFAMVFEFQPLRSMRSTDLVEESLVFATAPQQAHPGRAVTLAHALGSNLVFFSERDMCWRAVHEAASAAGLQVNVAHKVASLDVIRHMIGRGVASAILPYGIVEEEMRRGELAVHTFSDCAIRRRMSLIWASETTPTRETDAFVGFVTDVVLALHAKSQPHLRLIHPAGLRRSSDERVLHGEPAGEFLAGAH